LRQREDQFGFERALDVDVQLGLGHGPQQVGQGLSRGGWGEVHGAIRWRRDAPCYDGSVRSCSV
jgi:hypothetical protein